LWQTNLLLLQRWSNHSPRGIVIQAILFLKLANTIIKATGFFAYNAFPDSVITILAGLETSANIKPVRSTAKSGISSTVAAGTMTGHGGRVPAGGIRGAAYTYYAHQTATSLAGVQKLMDLGLVGVCYHLICLTDILTEGDYFA
jgi:hypothetical protein